MTGDLCLYRPGEEPTATLVADADGGVAERGDALEISGEGANHPQVRSNTGDGNFVATLVDTPPDFDPDAEYADGDVVGPATVRVTHYIEWLPVDDGATAIEAGDNVIVGGDGARPADLAGADTADMVVGPAWKTSPSDSGTGGKVAVVRAGR